MHLSQKVQIGPRYILLIKNPQKQIIPFLNITIFILNGADFSVLMTSQNSVICNE